MGSRVVNGRGDVVLLRATMVIAGVRRRFENDVGVAGQGRARDDCTGVSRKQNEFRLDGA